jgi:lysylphosphatidylglycerol synthetase-like protein (DUF2156 family)
MLTAWWLIGDQSVPNRTDLVYPIGPWTLPSWLVTAIGALGVALLAVGTVILVRSHARPGWWIASGLAALAGLVLAYVERWATAGVVGAPIGAVLLFITGVPIVLALASASAFLTWVLGRSKGETVASDVGAP